MSDVVTIDFSHHSLRTLKEILPKAVDLPKIEEPKNDPPETGNNITRAIVALPAEKLLEDYGSSLNDKLKSKRNPESQPAKRQKVLVINLGYNYLKEITGIYDVLKKLHDDIEVSLQWLDLQHNNISSLPSCLVSFTQLKVLYLQGNNISDLSTFAPLKALENLRNLTVHANPIVNIPSFRLYLIRLLSQIRKLDWTLITRKEKDDAAVYVMVEGTTKRVSVYKKDTVENRSPLRKKHS